MTTEVETGELYASSAYVYYAPYGTDLPPITHQFGTPWPSPWKSVGLTRAETVVTMEYSVVEFDSEQRGIVLVKPSGKQTTTLETELSQINDETLQLVYGGVKTTVTEGGVTYTVIKGGTLKNFDIYAFGYEGEFADGRPMRTLLYKCISQLGSTETSGAETPSGIPLKVQAYPDLSKPRGQDVWEKQFQPPA